MSRVLLVSLAMHQLEFCETSCERPTTAAAENRLLLNASKLLVLAADCATRLGPTANFREMFRLRSSMFDVRTSKSGPMFDLLGHRTLKSKFGLRSSGSHMELRSQTSMFNVPPHPSAQATYYVFFFFFFFFCLLFHAKFRSETSMFNVPSSPLPRWPPTICSMFSFLLLSFFSFAVGFLKSGFKVQTWNLEHLWEVTLWSSPSSFHAHSSQACRLFEVRFMVFWSLRLCIPLLLSWDFGVRPCMHTATFS